MRVTTLKQVHYDPSVFFNVETVDEAVQVILTPEAGLTSAQRWKAEAPFLMELLERHVPIELNNSCILDYGCGIGRMAKPLIEKHNCSVIGVDISPNMRALAASCVDSDNFFAIPPKMLLHVNANAGLGFEGALAIWTLQHVLDLELEIAQIYDSVTEGGWLFVVNNNQRAIPSNAGPWLDDGKNVHAMIVAAGFECLERGQLQGDDIARDYMISSTFWAMYRKT